MMIRSEEIRWGARRWRIAGARSTVGSGADACPPGRQLKGGGGGAGGGGDLPSLGSTRIRFLRQLPRGHDDPLRGGDYGRLGPVHVPGHGRGRDRHRPVRNDFSPAAFYFIFWLVLGCFTMMNLFVGSVCDNFTRIKAEEDGSATMTDEQKQWVRTMQESNFRQDEQSS